MSQPAFSDDASSDGSATYHGSSPAPTRIVVILVLGLFAILLVWALRPEEPVGQGEAHPAVEQVLSNFELTPLIGDAPPVTSESIQGEVVLLNFWGTWCPPCMMEFPHLVKMNDRLKHNKRFRFVPVCCGRGGSDIDEDELRAGAEAYLAKLDTDLDVYSDPGGGVRMNVMLTAELPGFSFPTTVLLDGTG
ncbi:MAG: TlpA disulfide reductase family protein, partial [Pirellulaceae bacterium]